jgi:hypothetical protein
LKKTILMGIIFVVFAVSIGNNVFAQLNQTQNQDGNITLPFNTTAAAPGSGPLDYANQPAEIPVPQPPVPIPGEEALAGGGEDETLVPPEQSGGDDKSSGDDESNGDDESSGGN